MRQVFAMLGPLNMLGPFNNTNNAFIYIAQHYITFVCALTIFYPGFMDQFIPMPFQLREAQTPQLLPIMAQ